MGASASTNASESSSNSATAVMPSQANSPTSTVAVAKTGVMESNPVLASPKEVESKDASWSGAAARAATATLQGVSRVGSAMFRAPIKVFRQNKFDLAEGHQPVLQQAQYLKTAAATSTVEAEAVASSAAASGKKTKKPSALKVLMAEQGRSSTLLKQVLPSLVANIAVGTVMFKTFDSTIDFFARKRITGEVPAWMCSSCLSNGNLPLQSSSSSSPASSSFTSAYVGPDVFIAGALSGAAQSVLVVPMENSSSWIRQKYALLQHRMTQSAAIDAVKAASSSAVSASTLEATAMNFVPPVSPSANIATMNLANSIREMITGKAPVALFPSHVSTPDSSSLTAAAAPSVRPPSALFSHLTFRMTRDAIGLSIFFFAFEKIHSSMKVVPFRWLEMQEKQVPTATIIANRSIAPTSSVSVPAAVEPSAYELGTFLAWDCVSVLTAGAIAGYGYHVASWPFFQVLQHIETKQLNHLLSSPFKPPSASQFSAWGELRRVQQTGGFKSLFEGVFGEKSTAKTSAAQTLKRPKLFNPLVLGLVVYTLTKTEHQTHQIQEWRAARSAAKHQLA